MKADFLSTAIFTLSSSLAIAQTPTCRSFEATIPLQMFKDGCASEIGLCTIGTVVSSEAALNGATWKFIAHALAESAGLPSLPKTMQSYAGKVVVTAKEGGTFKFQDSVDVEIWNGSRRVAYLTRAQLRREPAY